MKKVDGKAEARFLVYQDDAETSEKAANPEFLKDLAQAGVKRVSVGGMLCRLALAHVASAAREMKEHGSFGWMAQAMPAAELRRMFT